MRYQGGDDLLEAEVQQKVAALLGETGFGDRVDRLRALASGLADASNIADLAEILSKTPCEERTANSFV